MPTVGGRLVTLCPVNDVRGNSVTCGPRDHHCSNVHSFCMLLFLWLLPRLLARFESLHLRIVLCVVGEVGVEVLFAEECLAAVLALVLPDACVGLLVPLQASCKTALTMLAFHKLLRLASSAFTTAGSCPSSNIQQKLLIKLPG